MRQRFWINLTVICAAAFCWSATAFAQDAPPPAADNAPAAVAPKGDILTAVPDSAWASLCIRNAAELDEKMMNIGQRLNLMPMSMLGMAKMSLGLMAGVNDNGSVAVVLMPVENVADIMPGISVLVPCTDYAALTSMIKPEPVEGGLSRVMLAGQDSYIVQYGEYAAISNFPSALQALLNAKENSGMGKVWTNHQVKRFAEDDLTLWVNVKAIVASPTFQGMIPMLAMMSGGSFNVEEIKDYNSITVSLSLNNGGLRIGFYTGMSEGSNSAKLLASGPSTSETLLKGLPADDYLVSVGSLISKEQADKAAKSLGTMLANPMLAMQLQLDPMKVSEISAKVAEALSDARGVAFSISGLSPGPDGLIGMTKVVTVAGSAKDKCAKIAEIIEIMTSGLVNSEEGKQAMEEVMSIVKYTPEAESIGGVSVDHLAVKIDQVDDVSPEDYQKLQKVVGSEGVLVRLAAVDDKHLVVTFGGGKQRMARSLELIKAGQAPLADDASIKNAAKSLPTSRSIEGYVSVDNVVETIAAIQKAVDEGGMPPFGKVNAAAAFVAGTVGGTGYQVDVAIPMELIVAIKDMIVSSTMPPQPPTTPQPMTDSEPASVPGS